MEEFSKEDLKDAKIYRNPITGQVCVQFRQKASQSREGGSSSLQEDSDVFAGRITNTFRETQRPPAELGAASLAALGARPKTTPAATTFRGTSTDPTDVSASRVSGRQRAIQVTQQTSPACVVCRPLPHHHSGLSANLEVILNLVRDESIPCYEVRKEVSDLIRDLMASLSPQNAPK